MNKKSILLLGASGLVGGECLKLLIHDGQYEKITVLTRSPLTTSSTLTALANIATS
jgi:uncharacterized protein YbjT (DUF2867 family)